VCIEVPKKQFRDKGQIRASVMLQEGKTKVAKYKNAIT
jgi:hypothetical protein